MDGPPKKESPTDQAKPAQEDAGPPGPAAISIAHRPENADRKAQDQSPQGEKEGADRWGVTNTIALIAVLVSVAEVLALILTICVQATSSRRQLRAYVFSDGIGINNFSGGQPPRIDAVFMNFGQTPAYEINIKGELIWGTLPQPHGGFPVNTPKRIESQGAIGPGSKFGQFVISPRPASAQELGQIVAGHATFYYFGHITYRDAFRRKHTTNFRFFYYNGRMNMCAEGNEAD